MRSKIIGLIGDTEDLTLTYIKWLCDQSSIPTILFEEEEFGHEWILEYQDNDINQGHISMSSKTISIRSIAGFFVRLNSSPKFKGTTLSSLHNQIAIRERRLGIKYFLNSLSIPVVNSPKSGLSNCSKPYQMRWLSSMGFKVPKWIVTNDANEIIEFKKRCSFGAIFKSCSGLRSHVKMVDENFLSKVRKGSPPVVVQEYIEGDDCRVHVINGQVFPTRIDSNSVDYRFSQNRDNYSICQLPKKLEILCHQATTMDNLVLSGLDFKIDSDSNWYCLEMNPVPTFIPYELSTQQAVGRAVINYILDRS